MNFYAVILDAGFPYKGQNHHICTLKVIDPSLYPLEDLKRNPMKFRLITCYAHRMEELPVVRKNGDVIRVHGAVVKEFKGEK